MKGFVVSIFLSAVLLTVRAGEMFADEKQTAIKDIETRFNATVRMSGMILNAADSEKKNTDTRGEAELLAQLDIKVNDTRIQLEKDAKAVMQTAIIKAKPVSVIHCIRNVTFQGYSKIDASYDAFWERVVLIRLKKIEKVDFDVYAVNAIVEGLRDLIDQAKNSIQNGGIIVALKKEALNNCQSADMLLGEIEVCLHEPILSKEYIKLRQEIDRSLAKLKFDLNAALEKCLDVKQ